MDYFDSNFNNDREDQHSELPDDFSWEDMKGGIYNKMHVKPPSRLSKYWPFLILLLVAGCGTGSWFALNSLNGDAVINNSIVVEQTINANTPSNFNPSQSNANTVDKNQPEQITQLSLPTVKELKSKKTSSSIPNSIRSIHTDNSKPVNDNTTTSHEASTIIHNSINQTKNIVNFNQKNQITNESATIAITNWNTFNGLPSITIEDLENKTDQLKIVDKLKGSEIVKDDKATDKKTSFKKQLTIGLAGGVMNWAASDPSNINHDYVSGYPGYTINPSVAYSFAPKHAIQFDYEYSAIQELFEYEGSHQIEVYKENEIYKQTHSSLTGNVISFQRKDIVSKGNRSYKEVKYNQYKLHTLSLGYRFDQIKKKKSAFGFYIGASYLLQINSQGKRLNEHLDVVSFDSSNPLFEKSQFGLRFGLSYNYQLSANTKLFSQIITTKYLTNWEIDNSESATRPLLYGLQIGLSYRL